MSDDVENQETTEVEAEDQDTRIDDFINSIADGNFNQSEKIFNELLQDKMHAALDDEKINVANDIYNSIEGEPLADPDIDDDADLEN